MWVLSVLAKRLTWKWMSEMCGTLDVTSVNNLVVKELNFVDDIRSFVISASFRQLMWFINTHVDMSRSRLTGNLYLQPAVWSCTTSWWAARDPQDTWLLLIERHDVRPSARWVTIVVLVCWLVAASANNVSHNWVFVLIGRNVYVTCRLAALCLLSCCSDSSPG